MSKFLKKAPVVVLTVVLMLLTCEAGTRLFTRAPRDVAERDPLIGRRYQPNLNERVYNHEADQPVLLRTNQFGFRGETISVQKPPGTYRVAVLGDSYTAAQALPEDQTYCARLQALLNDSGRSENWEVLNFGIPGAGTGQELALYRHVVRNLDVDVVVIAFGNATDVRDNSQELGTNPIIYFRVNEKGELEQVPQSEQRVTMSNWMNQTSRFYRWQKVKVSSLKKNISRQAKQQRGRHLIYAGQETEAYANAWKLTSAILNVFRNECRADGVRLVVAAIPSAHQVYPDHIAELKSLSGPDAEIDPLHPDRRLDGICRELGIPYLSLTQRLRDELHVESDDDPATHLFFRRDGHFTAIGSQIAAKELHSWL